MAESKEFSDNQGTGPIEKDLPRKEGETPKEYHTRSIIESLMLNVKNSKNENGVLNEEALLSGFKQTSEEYGEITGSIKEQSLTDPLTGLYNRDGFYRNVKELKRFSRKAVLSCTDIDGLKLVNDTFGHKVGDDFILLYSESIKSVVRPHDVIARFGGDEINIWMVGVDLKEAERIMERITENFHNGVKNSFDDQEIIDKTGFTFVLGEWEEEEKKKWEKENVKKFVDKIDEGLKVKKREKKENG